METITPEDDWKRTLNTSLDGAACEDCLFWQHLADDLGECRFRSPIPAGLMPGLSGDLGESPLLGCWPETRRMSWCGDFMRKETIDR